MKNLLLLLTFVTISLWGNEEITLSKIRFVINGEKLNWKTGSDLPINLTHDGTHPETLTRFFKYKPGDIVAEEELLKEVNRASFRLNDSNLFYTSSITVVPPRKFPQKRTVVIKINDGYRNIWGGGSIYGLVGKRNINGKGNSVIFTLGLNSVSAKYIDDSIGMSNFFSVYSLAYSNDFVEKEFESASHFGKLSYKLGYRFTPDFKLYTQAEYFTRDSNTDLTLGLNWENKFYLFKKNVFETELNSNYTLKTRDSSSFIESKVNNRYTIGFLALNLSLGGGKDIVPGENYSLSLIKYGVSYIRSKHRDTELEGDWYLYASFQVDKSFKVFSLPPIFNIKPIVSVFADISYISWGIRDAYGVAASIYFESPIFTSLDFSYGLNRGGEGKFIFTVKSHF